MFFLPPPQIKTLKSFSLTFNNSEDKAAPIILPVKSVNVAAPSSRDKPLAKETSKSFTSREKVFLLDLFK